MNTNPYIDAQGHRERVKFILKSRHLISKEGRLNWNYKVRSKLTGIIFKYEGSHKDCEKMIPDSAKYGVPTTWWATNEAMIELLNQNFTLENNIKYCVQFFSHKKTVTHIGFSAIIVEIKPIDKDKGLYEITRDNRLKRFWFRKQQQNE